jgi:formylglycine-generating enzyme required for sulfatase activity
MRTSSPRNTRSRLFLALPPLAFFLLAFGLPALEEGAFAKGKGCPDGMVAIRGRYCIDRYEASVVEVGEKRKTKPHSPYEPVEGLVIKAVSRRGVVPQAYISRDQAAEACKNAGKRLCSDDEWIIACKGKHATLYPYGEDHKDRACNDAGVSSFNRYYGPKGGGEAPQSAYTWENMNDPRLNRLDGTVAKTGAFARCKNGFDVYDMVGNLHEWTAAPNGTFRGGYYLDTRINGEGCEYKTTAHIARYHDYSTGFRCCR